MADKYDHAGSGIDKPHPKGLAEKIGDTVKSVVSKVAPSSETAPASKGTAPPK